MMRASHFKTLRKELGISQDELAQIMGVSSSTVAKWEQGKVRISGPASVLMKILLDKHTQQVTADR